MDEVVADAYRRRGEDTWREFELIKSLIDTDIFSEITKAVNPTVDAHATAYRRVFSRYTISAVTLTEVIRGHQKKQALRQLQHFHSSTPAEEVISFDRDTAELAGRITGDLERTGQPIGVSDPMIAAITIHHGLELVTGNTAHFLRVRQLRYKLTPVNWRV